MLHKGDDASDGTYTPGCQACWWTLVSNLMEEDRKWFEDIIKMELWMRKPDDSGM